MNGEQTPTERLQEHLGRLSEISAQATFGLHNWGGQERDHATVRAYHEIIEAAEQGARAIRRQLDGVA